MKEVYVGSTRIRLDPSKTLGEGGEAEVYDVSSHWPLTALKLWKPPSHPDFQGKDEQAVRNREGAKLRLEEQQQKIRRFPKNLPDTVIAPKDFVTDKNHSQIIGYTMRLLNGAEALRSYAQLRYRKDSGISNNEIITIFRNLHGTVSKVHSAKVVIGDFNYLNVLIKEAKAYLIDADSAQYGGFPGRTFTSRFVDPLICDPKLSKLIQIAAHSENTDWYAFALMLFESLVLVHPYGGLYEPKDPKKRMAQDARPLHRISVFEPEVVYPQKGTPLSYLPDEILHFYVELLKHDKRVEFPEKLLSNLRWTRCTNCGLEHGRRFCPSCATRTSAEALKETVRGNVSVQRVFRTSGVILRAAMHDGKLRYLYHEAGEFKREKGGVVYTGNLSPDLHFKLAGDQTVLATQGQLKLLGPGTDSSFINGQVVEHYRGLTPVFDSNGERIYWLCAGRLLRDDTFGPKDMGGVLAGQSWFRVGPKFGFGFYRAGGIQVAFVFDALNPGINDRVALPNLAGQILDANCYFSESRCWFVVTVQESGKTKNRCFLIKSDGTVLDSAEAEEGDGTWLSELSGKAAVTLPGTSGNVNCLFAATEAGLVRIQEEQGRIIEAAQFPDTKGLLSPEDSLFFGREGLYLVNRREVRLMRISAAKNTP